MADFKAPLKQLLSIIDFPFLVKEREARSMALLLENQGSFC